MKVVSLNPQTLVQISSVTPIYDLLYLPKLYLHN